MRFAFAGLFFVGLIVAVRVMLYGVERSRAPGDDAPRSFARSPAVLASMLSIIGIIGYVLDKRGVAPVTSSLIALAVGVVVALATARAMARWWIVVPEHDVDDERYVLQGSLAQVVAAIGANGTGEVTLNSKASDRLPARSIDEQPVAAGTEVVIERIENGVAYVEQWAEVEKRL